MQSIYPKKLQSGDEIRVLSPSSSMARVGGIATNQKAIDRLTAMGFKVSFSQNVAANDMLDSTTIANRVADLHDAFKDDRVKMILATIGGYNSIELLPYLDYDLIKANPKIVCGYSDTTALTNAIYAKTGLVTYYGPSFSSFTMDLFQDYQSGQWLQAVKQNSYQLQPSPEWSSDNWYQPELPRNPKPNQWTVYTAGTAKGTAIIGNLDTFGLLKGTTYFPAVEKPVLMIESAQENDFQDFNRELAAILLVYPDPQAVLIGRFPKESAMTEEKLLYMLEKYPILKEIPVMYDLNFGHAQPIFTFELGGQIMVETATNTIKVNEI